MAFGVLWFLGTVCGAFMCLVGSPMACVMSVAELAAASVPVGAIVSAWAVYLVASLSSNLAPMTMILSNLMLVALVARAYPRFWRNWRHMVDKGVGADAVDSAVCGVIFAVLGAVFWPLYKSRMIPFHDGKIWSGGSCWADLPIHMHIAEAFLQGRNSDISWGGLSSPVFAGEKMYYPFLPDFHAAVMKRLGGELSDAFFWTGWLMACSLWVLLYCLTVRVTRSRLGGVLAILITIGAGGMGGPSYIWNRGWAEALNVDVAQNDVTGGYKIFWFAFIPHVLLPQRGANFAYPLAVFILLLVWRATDMGLRLPFGVRRSLLTYAAGLAASLPMVQAHSFIGLGLLIGTYFLLDAHKWLAHPQLAAGWAQAGAVAAVVGYPQMAFFQKQVAKGAGGKFITLGWIYKDNDFGKAGGLSGFFSFWWASLGPAVPLYLLTLGVSCWDIASAGWHATSLRAKGGLQNALSCYGSDIVASAVTGSGGSDEGLDQFLFPGTAPPSSGAAGVRTLSSSRKRRDSDDDSAYERHDYANRTGSIHYDDGGGSSSNGVDASASSAAAAAVVADDTAAHDVTAISEIDHTAPAYATSAYGGRHSSNSLKPSAGKRPGAAVTTLSLHLLRLRVELSQALLAARESAVATAAAAGGPQPSQLDLALHTSANFLPILAQALRKSAYSTWRPGRGMRLMRALYGYDGPQPRSIGTHFMEAILDNTPDALADVIEGRASLAITWMDDLLSPLNALSLTGRSLDGLKLSLSALVVWMVGNYVNFQPWDRDNCKLFYLWVFVYSAFIGALLAAPFEFLLGLRSGYARLMALVGAPFSEVLQLARGGSSGGWAMNNGDYSNSGNSDGSVMNGGSSWGAGVAQLSSAMMLPPSGVRRKEKRGDDDDEDDYGGSARRHSTLPLNSASSRPSSLSSSFTKRRIGARVLAGPCAAASAATLALMTVTGLLMVVREYGMNHVMFDEDAIAVGKWISQHTPPSSVMLHRDHHIFASGSLAGRPALLAYTGWMSSHGYNYYERDRDRNHILANILKDSDPRTHELLFKWGVRYVLGEWLPIHFRPSEAQAEEAAIALRTASSDEERSRIQRVDFDPNVFLSGSVKRVFKAGRFDVLEVQGYGSYTW